jgi:hypothetical protein
MLVERNNMSMEEASDSLRLYSRDHNITLTDLDRVPDSRFAV